MENANTKISSKVFEKLSSSFALDLTAVFNLIQEDIFKLLNKANKEAWTPTELLSEIEKIT
jgi:hypothetical protein